MRVLIALLIGVTSLVGAVPASAQEATPTAESASAKRTNVRYFLPYTPDGLAADLTEVGEASGACLFPSLADVGRPDAWACMELETSQILDPCFENPFPPLDEPAQLACVASPFSPEVVRFTLTQPLQRFKEGATEDAAAPQGPGAPQPPMPPASGPGGAPDAEDAAPADVAAEAIDPREIPWALELANGTRCGLLTGATAVLAGQRINYGCEDGGFVLGEVDHALPMWTVTYLAEGASATDLVDVVTAWT